MEIRRAQTNDADLLARHRAAVWHEVGDWSVADLEPQIPIWAAFFARTIASERYVAFIAEEGGAPVGSAAILVHLAIPRPGTDSDRAGRLQSVYVDPAARRRGIARAVVVRLIEHAREIGLISLALHPSDEARALYLSLGFEAADELALRLSAPHC